jgi:hypothetical protein
MDPGMLISWLFRKLNTVRESRFQMDGGRVERELLVKKSLSSGLNGW